MKDEGNIKSRTDIEPILKEIVEVLVRDYQPETIILYGSYAYGNPTRHSDIDLFIVKETEKNRIDRYVEVAGLIFDPDRYIPVQPLVMTPAELEEGYAMTDYFIKEVLTRGVKLYERSKRVTKVTARVVSVR